MRATIKRLQKREKEDEHNMYVACDKDGTLHTHQTKPIRAQYGRGVKDTFWESDTKQQATQELRKEYCFMRWEHDPIEVNDK